MNRKYTFVFFLLVVLTIGSFAISFLFSIEETKQVKNKETLKVVTSFYPMYIAALNLTDQVDGITLENLSEPTTGCLHDFVLVPEDLKLLSTADVFIINGGGMESFLAEVAKEFPQLTIIDTSKNLTPIGENAHFWLSIPSYMTQVNTIAEGLIDKEGTNEKAIEENCSSYIEQLESLQEMESQLKDEITVDSVILLHEGYEFLAQDLDLTTSYLLNLDEERQVSAGEIAQIIATIKDEQVGNVLAEELYGLKTGNMLEKETNAKVWYLDTLVRGDNEKNSYVDGMRNNLLLLKEALRES